MHVGEEARTHRMPHCRGTDVPRRAAEPPLVLSGAGKDTGRRNSHRPSHESLPHSLREDGAPEKHLTCINISEGGLYLRTADPRPGGTILHVKFTLPHDTEPIKLTAEVVRSLQLGTQLNVEPGMGVRFLDISENTLSRIRNFVQWEMMGDVERQSNI